MLSGTSIEALWDREWFLAAVFVHKVLAVGFYITMLRTTMNLGKPEYYHREFWT